MKLLALVAFALTVVTYPGVDALVLEARAPPQPGPQGIDVSSHQHEVNWRSVKASGVEFAYIKATEGTNYVSPQFNGQYAGATNVGLIRGGYHFALPNRSPGAVQAQFFLAHGGGWGADGRTLPGALDIENNPNGPKCYGLNPDAMVAWIHDFSNFYRGRTGRPPVIYTTTDWWMECTGNYPVFGRTNPLWIARFGSSIGRLPAGWQKTTFWQYADDATPNPGDADLFNGNSEGLHNFARG